MFCEWKLAGTKIGRAGWLWPHLTQIVNLPRRGPGGAQEGPRRGH